MAENSGEVSSLVHRDDLVGSKEAGYETRDSVSSSESLDEQISSSKDPVCMFDNLSHWICCVCIVTFDLELGQAIEVSILVIIVLVT